MGCGGFSFAASVWGRVDGDDGCLDLSIVVRRPAYTLTLLSVFVINNIFNPVMIFCVPSLDQESSSGYIFCIHQPWRIPSDSIPTVGSRHRMPPAVF